MSADEYMAGTFFRLHPAAAARLLESMEIEAARAAISTMPAADIAPVLQKLLPPVAARYVESLPVPIIVDLLNHLPSQTGAALLRYFDEEARPEILMQLGGPRAAALQLLLRYPKTAVGAWMETNALVLPAELSLRDARRRMEGAEGSGVRIYVLDRECKVRGAIDGLQLLRAGDVGRVVTIAEDVESLWAREPLADARKRDLWNQVIELPVVNRSDEFVGVISQRAIESALKELGDSKVDWGNTGASREVFDTLLVGLEGAWESFVEIIDVDVPEKREEKS